ncbi:uncharacterized protein JCM6883_006858 [Sporobolomyces salmoneus]|uniref:uncharacterized protein n=1 Tax=Sporobolomyces salmoneus TaxID=183962 RepID=UPI00316BF6D4
MEEAERLRQDQQRQEFERRQWHDGTESNSTSTSNSDNYYAPPPPPPSNYPPPVTWQQFQHEQQVGYRHRPPHPDNFYQHPSYLDYSYHSSPDISPLTQTSYPLYPVPNHSVYSDPSPSNSVGASTPSPYATPLPPSSQPTPYYPAESSYRPTYGAVESARWMATMDGTDEETVPPQFPPASFRDLHPSQHPPSALPAGFSMPYAPLSVDTSYRPEAAASTDRRPSDSSLASNDSSFAFARNEGIPGDEASSVKPFIEKLYGILARPDTYGDVMKWSDSGDSFFVAHSERFIREVLPEQFSHQNIHSFTRQLNVYNFTRMSIKQLREGLSMSSATTSEYSGWSHPLFKRGDTTTLSTLNPRPSRARLLKKLEKQYGATPLSQSMSGESSSGSGSGGGSGKRSRTEKKVSDKKKSMSSIDEHG